jgi:rhamnosyl/mannosyltransferase
VISRDVQDDVEVIAGGGEKPLLAQVAETYPTSVLHIGKFYRPHTGGMETHLGHLVSYQSARMAVEVVVANDRPVNKNELLDGARITRVASFGSLASQPICPWLPMKLAGRSESIVHLHLPNPWAAQAYLMSGHKGKLVITHHADTLGRRHLRKLVDPIVRRAMNCAEAIIVTSKGYLESSEELAGYRDKCRVVPLGIDGEAFREDATKAVGAIREKYGTRVILAVGRLVPYKGFEFLVEAMQHVDAKLVLIGTGPQWEQLEAIRKSLSVANKVQLLGHVEDLVPYYKASKMLVLPSVSRAESFGIVQLEAMASGIPVINTRVESGVPEVSIHDVTGLTVPPKDPRALAQAINLLLNNEETRIKYGQAARARAREEFSVQCMAESTVELYRTVLETNRKSC